MKPKVSRKISVNPSKVSKEKCKGQSGRQWNKKQRNNREKPIKPKADVLRSMKLITLYSQTDHRLKSTDSNYYYQGWKWWHKLRLHRNYESILNNFMPTNLTA